MLLSGILPFISFAQKDSIPGLRKDIQLLQSQMQTVQVQISKLEDQIPYYVHTLKLQQSPIVQTNDFMEIRLTKAYYNSTEKNIYIEGLLTIKDDFKKSISISNAYLITPVGVKMDAYDIYNGKNSFGIQDATQDIPYAFTIKYKDQEPIPKIALLKFSVVKEYGLKRVPFEFKGLTVE